jgi:hypothetical protein
VPEAWAVLADLEHFGQERRADDDRDGAAVAQDVREVARDEQRVRRHWDRAELDRAEERVHERRRVEAQDDDAVLDVDAETLERVAAAIDVRAMSPYVTEAPWQRIATASGRSARCAST